MGTVEMSSPKRWLPVSGTLLILGLLIQAATLLWSSPIAFLTFLFVGGAMVFAGVLAYLYSILSTRSWPSES